MNWMLQGGEQSDAGTQLRRFSLQNVRVRRFPILPRTLRHSARRLPGRRLLSEYLYLFSCRCGSRKSRLGWFGHLERKDVGDWVSACRNMVVPGYAGMSRPRKRFRDVLEDDLKKCHLDGSLAKDRDRWRAQLVENIRPVRARKKDVKREERDLDCF